MNDFRKITPSVKPVEELHFDHVQPITLKNGIVCYRLPRRDLGVIKLEIYWPYGTKNQNQIFDARAALSLSLSGTTKLTAEQINDEFEYQGTAISFETQLLNSVFHLKSTKEHFLTSISFFLENFMDATYPEHELANFIQIEQAGLMRKMQTPRYWANRLCFESLYLKGSPMASFANVEDIGLLKQEGLIAFQSRFLKPTNATFIVSGDTDDGLFDAFTALLQKIPQTANQPASEPFNEGMPEKIGINITKNVEHTSQVSLFMGKRIELLSENEIHKFHLLNMIMGGYFGSRLMQEIREEKGLTYGIGSYISQSTDGNVWCISGEMNTKNVEEARVAIIDILKGLVSNPPNGAELERAKRYYSGQLRTSFDGPFALANKLRNLFTRGYSYHHYDSAMKSIWSISSEELCQLADNYLKPETFNTVLAGDIGH